MPLSETPGAAPAEHPSLSRIVLLDEAGRAIGTAPKAASHHHQTPLHLAFSCYVFNDAEDLLVTRRSMRKATWPGVVTNSCCGHPSPAEPLLAAVSRCTKTELGATATTAELLLPSFRYEAAMADGTVENEICPVFRVRLVGSLDPDPSEVREWWWMPWRVFAADVLRSRLAVSPWCRSQVQQLATLGRHPLRWPGACVQSLPSGARESNQEAETPSGLPPSGGVQHGMESERGLEDRG